MPVSREVWPYVADAMWLHLKEEYRDTINAAQHTSTLRTLRAVDRDLEKVRSQRHRTVMDLLSLYDDLDDDLDSTYAMIHYLTDSLSEKHWEKLAVGTCLSADTLSWARTVLGGISVDDAEDTAFYDFMDLSLNLAEDTLTWFDMDGTQQTLLGTIADGSTKMRPYARSVFALLADTVRFLTPEPLPELPSAKWAQDAEDESTDSPITDVVKVYPNPFTDDFVVEFSLAEEAEEVYIEVFDLTGRRVFVKRLGNIQAGRTLVDPGPCNGTYIMRMTVDGRPFKHEKLICMQGRQ